MKGYRNKLIKSLSMSAPTVTKMKEVVTQRRTFKNQREANDMGFERFT